VSEAANHFSISILLSFLSLGGSSQWVFWVSAHLTSRDTDCPLFLILIPRMFVQQKTSGDRDSISFWSKGRFGADQYNNKDYAALWCKVQASLFATP